MRNWVLMWGMLGVSSLRGFVLLGWEGLWVNSAVIGAELFLCQLVSVTQQRMLKAMAARRIWALALTRPR